MQVVLNQTTRVIFVALHSEHKWHHKQSTLSHDPIQFDSTLHESMTTDFHGQTFYHFPCASMVSQERLVDIFHICCDSPTKKPQGPTGMDLF
jgi:hypothetical protein